MYYYSKYHCYVLERNLNDRYKYATAHIITTGITLCGTRSFNTTTGVVGQVRLSNQVCVRDGRGIFQEANSIQIAVIPEISANPR